jgi:hypothetical protein
MNLRRKHSRPSVLSIFFLQRRGRRIGLHSRFQGEPESGRSLPAALITLAVGSLLLTPFLAFVSSRALGSRAAEDSLNSQYAADAGIEFGIWSVLNNSTFRSLVDNNLGTPQTLSFPGTLNGYTPTISVTGLPIGSWYIRQSTPANMERGSSLAYNGGDRIYALRGANTRSFGYYSINNDQWYSLANAPGNVRQGGSLVYAGNYLYALRGNNQENFWRYNISSDSWTSLEDTPDKVQEGGELVLAGSNRIYAFQGKSKNFWRYSISADDWTEMDDAPSDVRYGSDLAYNGGNLIYALRGRNQTDFWSYNISGDSWNSLQNTPDRVNNGGNLAYSGGNYIYALKGTDTTFWRYTINTDSWSELTPTPAGLGRGADLVFTNATGGYATRGGNQTDFWEFEVTPPRFDIEAQAGSVSTDARLEVDGFNKTILFWDIN